MSLLAALQPFRIERELVSRRSERDGRTDMQRNEGKGNVEQDSYNYSEN